MSNDSQEEKHKYKKIENNYIMIGYRKCEKCGKEKYFEEDSEFTELNLGEFRLD